MMLVPSLFVATLRNNPAGRMFSGLAEPYLPLLLLGVTLMFVFTSAGEQGALFQPLRGRFPVPGTVPSTRAARLQAHEDARRLDLDGTHFLRRHVCSTSIHGSRPSSASFLTLAFVQLLAIAIAFLAQIVAEQAYNRRRRLVLLCIIGVLVFAALAQMLWQTPLQSPAELARSLRGSWAGMVLLAPFEVFSHAILAKNWFPELVCWSAGGAGNRPGARWL